MHALAKGQLLLCGIAFFCFAATAPRAAVSGTDTATEPCWGGQISISISGHGSKRLDRSTRTKRDIYEYRRTKKASLAFRFVLDGHGLKVLRHQASGRDQWSTTSTEQYDHQVCESREQPIARPGNGSFYESHGSLAIVPIHPAEGEKAPGADLSFIVFPQGEYHLLFGTRGWAWKGSVSEKSSSYWACTGKTDESKSEDQNHRVQAVFGLATGGKLTGRGASGHRILKQGSDKGRTPFEETLEQKWDVVKARDCRCLVFVESRRGDVYENGEPLSSSVLDASRPTQIDTGRRSRVKLTLGPAMIHMASGSSVDLTEVCEQEPEKPSVLDLVKGAIWMLVMPDPGPFEIHTKNAVDGSRGEAPRAPILLASTAVRIPLSSREDRLRALYRELKPAEEDLAAAATVFFMSVLPHDYLYIKVEKGKIRVLVGDESEKPMSAGEAFFEKLGRPAPPKNRDIIVKTRR